MRKTDIELINEILNGNHVLFEEIVDRYQSSVFVIALGFVQNREDAEDIAQEVMVNIFCNLNKFKGDSLFSTWVYRIAVNGSLDFLKKNKNNPAKRGNTLESEKMLEAICESYKEEGNSVGSLITRDNLRLFSIALNNIPIKQKAAFVLQRYRDLSVREISQILKVSEKAVESLLSRAKQNLQILLKPYFKDE